MDTRTIQDLFFLCGMILSTAAMAMLGFIIFSPDINLKNVKKQVTTVAVLTVVYFVVVTVILFFR